MENCVKTTSLFTSNGNGKYSVGTAIFMAAVSVSVRNGQVCLTIRHLQFFLNSPPFYVFFFSLFVLSTISVSPTCIKDEWWWLHSKDSLKTKLSNRNIIIYAYNYWHNMNCWNTELRLQTTNIPYTSGIKFISVPITTQNITKFVHIKMSTSRFFDI